MRQTLTRERIVEAALALADRDGPDAVTMRRLGRELGVEGMAIYTHFENKAELMTAVAARVLAELELDPAPGVPWQERLRHVIRSWAGMRDRHPGGFPLLYRRRDWAAQDFPPIEEILGALRAAGLSPENAVLAYHAIVWMLDGILLASTYGDEPVASAWAGMAADVDPGTYPRFVEAVPHAVRVTPRRIFEFGSELVVRGLEQLVESGSS